MSDIDDLLYSEDYDYADEYGTADDIAEHVLPSPVWISYDPDFDIESPRTDWEDYFSDEYYDEETGTVRKRKENDGRAAMGTVEHKQLSKKRRKLGPLRPIPELKMPEKRKLPLEPTVIWRSGSSQVGAPHAQEVVTEGQGRKVALLSDWRERFQIEPAETRQAQASYHDVEAEEHDVTGLFDSEKGVGEEQDATILPPLSLTSGNVGDLYARTRDRGHKVHENGEADVSAGTPSEDELPLKATSKRKASALDKDDSKPPVQQKKPRRSKMSIVESVEPAKATVNGDSRSHTVKRKLSHESLDSEGGGKEQNGTRNLDQLDATTTVRRSRRKKRA